MFCLIFEIAYSNNRPEDSDVIKAQNLCFSNVTLNENEAVLPQSLLASLSCFDEKLAKMFGANSQNV